MSPVKWYAPGAGVVQGTLELESQKYRNDQHCHQTTTTVRKRSPLTGRFICYLTISPQLCKWQSILKNSTKVKYVKYILQLEDSKKQYSEIIWILINQRMNETPSESFPFQLLVAYSQLNVCGLSFKGLSSFCIQYQISIIKWSILQVWSHILQIIFQHNL